MWDRGWSNYQAALQSLGRLQREGYWARDWEVGRRDQVETFHQRKEEV